MNKPHEHAELIKAWADGAIIQNKINMEGVWADVGYNNPKWYRNVKYRIKPVVFAQTGPTIAPSDEEDKEDADFFRASIDLHSDSDVHNQAVVVWRESKREAEEIRDVLVKALNEWVEQP